MDVLGQCWFNTENNIGLWAEATSYGNGKYRVVTGGGNWLDFVEKEKPWSEN